MVVNTGKDAVAAMKQTMRDISNAAVNDIDSDQLLLSSSLSLIRGQSQE
jgi:hypothetical protein